MRGDGEIFSVVCDYIDAHYDDIIAMWKRFVDLRSDATEKEKADAMSELLKSELEAIGCECKDRKSVV